MPAYKTNYILMREVKALFSLAILLAISYYGAEAQTQKMSVSLRQAQDYALENSIEIKDGKFDLEVAQKKVWESTAIGLPQADAKLSYTYNPGTLPTISFSESSPPVQVGTKSSSVLTGTVSQLIFSGSYIVGLQSAKTYKEMIAQGLEKTKIDLKEAVTQSYYLILLTSETNAVLQNNLVNLKKTLFDTEKMLEKGFVEATSVDQLRISVNEMELSLSNIKRQEQVARRLLNFQLGLNLDAEIDLTDKLENIVLGINRDRVIDVPFDLAKNINYNMVETQIKVNKLLYKLEVSSYLPTIAGFYQYQRYLNNQSFNFQPENLLGLTVSLPIFSSGQRASKVSQARLNLSKAELAKEQVSRSLNLEYQQTRDDFNTAWDKYLNSKSNLALAQKVQHEVTIKFTNGMATSMEVTQANDKLLQTISNHYSVEFDLLKAKLHLDKVTSNL